MSLGVKGAISVLISSWCSGKIYWFGSHGSGLTILGLGLTCVVWYPGVHGSDNIHN